MEKRGRAFLDGTVVSGVSGPVVGGLCRHVRNPMWLALRSMQVSGELLPVKRRANLAPLLVEVLALAGCSSSGPSANANNFTGVAWSGTITTTTDCGDAGALALGACPPACPNPTSTGLFTLFIPGGSSHFSYQPDYPCTSNQAQALIFDFNVSGDTATLSDGPILCQLSTDGAVAASEEMPEISFPWTVSSFTLSSDGHHLTGTASGLAMLNGVTCTLSETLSATSCTTGDGGGYVCPSQ